VIRVNDELRRIPAIRPNLLLFIPALAFVVIQTVFAARVNDNVPTTVWLVAGTMVVVASIGMPLNSALVRRVNRRLDAVRTEYPSSLVFPVASSVASLTAWIAKRDSIFSAGSYPIVIVGDQEIRFLSSRSERTVTLSFAEITDIAVVQVTDRFFRRPAIELTTATGSLDLAPYGRLGVVGFRAATDEFTHELLTAVRMNAAAVK